MTSNSRDSSVERATMQGSLRTLLDSPDSHVWMATDETRCCLTQMCVLDLLKGQVEQPLSRVDGPATAPAGRLAWMRWRHA
jgi:hypothetical protein